MDAAPWPEPASGASVRSAGDDWTMHQRGRQRSGDASLGGLLSIATTVAWLTACDGTDPSGSVTVDDDVGFPAERWPSVRIPDASDWVDHGLILAQGEPGDWDHILWGGFAGSAIKRDGTHFLYYQGSSRYDEELGTVTDRAVGVATSRDGLRFEKSPANPVLTWQPNDGPEEGAVSTAALIGSEGQTILYYGANTEIDKFSVHADARVATSRGGIEFTDRGVVLAHDDSSVWGFGDELFPILALTEAGSSYLYYLPNGGRRSGHLSVAWGPGYHDFQWSGEVQAPTIELKVWSMASAVRLGDHGYGLALNEGGRLQIRLVDLARPWRVSEPIHTYEFDNMSSAFVLHDETTGVWYLYYQAADFSGYGVRTATIAE